MGSNSGQSMRLWHWVSRGSCTWQHLHHTEPEGWPWPCSCCLTSCSGYLWAWFASLPSTLKLPDSLPINSLTAELARARFCYLKLGALICWCSLTTSLQTENMVHSNEMPTAPRKTEALSAPWFLCSCVFHFKHYRCGNKIHFHAQSYCNYGDGQKKHCSSS